MSTLTRLKKRLEEIKNGEMVDDSDLISDEPEQDNHIEVDDSELIVSTTPVSPEKLRFLQESLNAAMKKQQAAAGARPVPPPLPPQHRQPAAQSDDLGIHVTVVLDESSSGARPVGNAITPDPIKAIADEKPAAPASEKRIKSSPVNTQSVDEGWDDAPAARQPGIAWAFRAESKSLTEPATVREVLADPRQYEEESPDLLSDALEPEPAPQQPARRYGSLVDTSMLGIDAEVTPVYKPGAAEKLLQQVTAAEEAPATPRNYADALSQVRQKDPAHYAEIRQVMSPDALKNAGVESAPIVPVTGQEPAAHVPPPAPVRESVLEKAFFSGKTGILANRIAAEAEQKQAVKNGEIDLNALAKARGAKLSVENDDGEIDLNAIAKQGGVTLADLEKQEAAERAARAALKRRTLLQRVKQGARYVAAAAIGIFALNVSGIFGGDKGGAQSGKDTGAQQDGPAIPYPPQYAELPAQKVTPSADALRRAEELKIHRGLQAIEKEVEAMMSAPGADDLVFMQQGAPAQEQRGAADTPIVRGGGKFDGAKSSLGEFAQTASKDAKANSGKPLDLSGLPIVVAKGPDAGEKPDHVIGKGNGSPRKGPRAGKVAYKLEHAREIFGVYSDAYGTTRTPVEKIPDNKPQNTKGPST